MLGAGCGVTYGVGAGGGPVSRLVLRTLAADGAAASAVERSTTSTSVSPHTECYGSTCQQVEVTNVTTTYTVDPARAAQAQRAYQRLDEAISNTPYLRAYLVRWDNPPGPVSTEPIDGAAPGVVTFTPTTDVGGALPVTLTVGLRVLL